MKLKVIGKVESDFTEKFGIPRQSGIVPDLKAKIVFEPQFRSSDAIRGIEGYSHIWIIWQFSKSIREGWRPTVRPPRLGGNSRIGVFATRSPFRPNELGLSSVKLEKVEYAKNGPVLHISGADILNGTPIYDIKPYLPYTDCHPEAVAGFSEEVMGDKAEVEISEEARKVFPEDKINTLIGLLKQDPRPSYKEAEMKTYGFEFAGYEITFEGFKNKIKVTKISKL